MKPYTTAFAALAIFTLISMGSSTIPETPTERPVAKQPVPAPPTARPQGADRRAVSAQPKGGPIIQTDISTEIDGKRYYLFYSNLKLSAIDHALIDHALTAMIPAAYFSIEDADIVKQFYKQTGNPESIPGYEPCVVATTGTKWYFSTPGASINYHNYLFVYSDMHPVWLDRVLRRNDPTPWRLATEREAAVFLDAIGNDKRTDREKKPGSTVGFTKFVATAVNTFTPPAKLVVIPGVWFSHPVQPIDGKWFGIVYSNLEVSKLEEVLLKARIYAGRLATEAEAKDFDRRIDGKKDFAEMNEPEQIVGMKRYVYHRFRGPPIPIPSVPVPTVP